MFLSGCTSLRDVDVTPLASVTRIGVRLLRGTSFVLPDNLDGFSDAMGIALKRAFKERAVTRENMESAL